MWWLSSQATISVTSKVPCVMAVGSSPATVVTLANFCASWAKCPVVGLWLIGWISNIWSMEAGLQMKLTFFSSSWQNYTPTARKSTRILPEIHRQRMWVVPCSCLSNLSGQMFALNESETISFITQSTHVQGASAGHQLCFVEPKV